jgi:hypothetical protein
MQGRHVAGRPPPPRWVGRLRLRLLLLLLLQPHRRCRLLGGPFLASGPGPARPSRLGYTLQAELKASDGRRAVRREPQDLTCAICLPPFS